MWLAIRLTWWIPPFGHLGTDLVVRLKCNREKPCQNCIVRGETTAASCTYAEKAEKKQHGQNLRSDEDMRKRLNRLENSILSMMSNDTERGDNHTSSTNSLSPENLVDRHSPTGAQVISKDTRSTHWDAILNDVSEIPNKFMVDSDTWFIKLGAMKEAWIEENDKIEFTNGFQEPIIAKPHRPGLLHGLTQPPDRATILASLTTREAVDKLMVRFFEYYVPTIPSRCE